MTAAAVEGERDRCLASGMDDFLTKPVDSSALRAVLGRWLHDDEGPATHPSDTEPGAAPPKETTMTEGLDRDRLDELRDLDPGDTTYLDRAIGNFVTQHPDDHGHHPRGLRGRRRRDPQAGGAQARRRGTEPRGRSCRPDRPAHRVVADSGSTDGAGDLVDELDAALEVGRTALLAYQASYSGGAAGAEPQGVQLRGNGTTSRSIRKRTQEKPMKGLIGLLVVVWLVIGVAAAFQRGYFGDDRDVNCKTSGDTVLTVLAGPLNYLGVNPKVNCNVPEPSN